MKTAVPWEGHWALVTPRVRAPSRVIRERSLGVSRPSLGKSSRLVGNSKTRQHPTGPVPPGAWTMAEQQGQWGRGQDTL